jgi:hypothetical protein
MNNTVADNHLEKHDEVRDSDHNEDRVVNDGNIAKDGIAGGRKDDG